jgi:hypothetical protein
MTKKNFNSSGKIALAVIVFFGFVTATAISAAEFNFRQMDLGNGVFSGRILNLRNMESSNIGNQQAERLMKNGFLSDEMESFGYYQVTLEQRYAGLGPHDTLMNLIGGLGTGATLGFGALFVPAREYRYEVTAKITFFDCNEGFIRQFTSSQFLDVKDSLATKGNYTRKGEPIYRKLLERCQQTAHQVADDINVALKKAKYPPPPPIEIVVEKVFKDLTANGNIPTGSRIAILGVDPIYSSSARITDQLEQFFIQDKRFQILDRRNIEDVINELRFGRSVFVDPTSAVQVGNILSASIIIVGDISGEGTNRRLTLRAVSVSTSEVLAVSSQKF